MQSSANPAALLTRVYALLGFGLFLSVADNSLRKLGLFPLPPTPAAALYFAPLAIYILAVDASSSPPWRRIYQLLRANAPVVVPFFLIGFLSLAYAMSPDAYWQEKGKWIFLLSYSFLIFLVASLLPLMPAIRNNYRLLCLAGLTALLGSIVTDVYYPMTFSNEMNRPAGFPSNSNWAALSSVMLTAASLGYDTKRTRLLDCIILVFAGMGVMATLSRSGTLNFGILVLYYVFRVVFFGEGGTRKWVELFAAVSLAGLLASYVAISALGSATSFANSNATGRLTGFLSGQMVDDGSTEGRMEAAQHAIRLIEDATIVGYGTGFTRTMGTPPHNLYLQQWVNNGLPGVLAYVTLLAGGLWMFHKRNFPPGVAFITVTAVGSLFSHNVLEQRTFLITLGVLSTVSFIDWRKRQPRAAQR